MHLRDGRTLTSYSQGTTSASKGTSKGKPSGNTPWRSGYWTDYHDEQWGQWQDPSSLQTSWHDDTEVEQYAGLFASEPVEEPGQETVDEEVEEWEAIVLNAVFDCGGFSDELDLPSIGEAVQLELAALAAFGKAKGKGKNKGKGKSKGKLVNNLTLEQRRAERSEIKARSK